MRIMRFVLCVTALLAVPCGLFAQAGATGSIIGTVTDTTGAVVPNAKVTVTNIATGVQIHTATSSAGDYLAPALLPGSYSVSAESKGFSKSVTANFTVAVDQTVRMNVALTAGAVTETVQVSAQGVALDTSDAALSQLVSQKQVADLPLDGRNFVQLLFLSPGAVTIGGEQGTMRQGEGDAISINGGRPEGNNFTLDGLTNNDTAMETPVVILSQDAILEFKVESGVYPAEYGFSVGQVNIVSKSGTNSLHGAVFESNRSYQFDAKPFLTATNFIDHTATFNPVLELNQFGFVAGGPVLIPKVYNGRNRSFWLANYEGWRMNNGTLLQESAPNTQMLGGNFSQETYPALPTQTVAGNPVPLPGGTLPNYGTPQCTALLTLGYNCMPVNPTTGQPFPSNTIQPGQVTARLAQVAIATKGFWGTPTVAGQPEGETNFVQNIPGPLHQNQQTYRGDQDLGKLGRVFGRFTKTNYVNSTNYNSGSPVLGLEQYYEDGLSWEVSHTISIGQRNVNTFRFGYLSANAPQGSATPPSSAVTALGIQNSFAKFGPLQQNWPGIDLTSYAGGGAPGNSYTGSYSPQWEFEDSFTSVRGRHTFGLGFDYRYWTITRNLDDQFYGGWSFSSNTIGSNSQPIPAGLPNGGTGVSSCSNAPVSVNGAGAVPLCGTGNAVADMMLGYYSGVSGFVPGPLSPTTQAGNPQDHAYHYIAPYFEDNWKVTPKLSIDYGLRYDFRAATYEVNNHFFWLDTTNTQGGLCYADPTLTKDGVAPGKGYNGGPILRYCGSVPRSAPKNPFAPRLAIDYRLTDKTVVRAGYGIFYGGYEGREIDDSADIYPYSIRLNLTPASTPDPVNDPKLSNAVWPAYGALTPFPVSTLSFIAVIESENPLNPYVETWTAAVQRQMTKDTTLQVDYIGNHGVHLLDRHDISQPNQIPASSLAYCQTQDPTTGAYVNIGKDPCDTTSRLPYRNFTGFYIDSDFHGYSFYNAGNVQLDHRANDLDATVIFTWSKSLDDKSATAGAGASGTGYQGYMNNHDPRLDYGPSDFYTPYRFVASYVYQLPFGRGKHFANNVNRAADLAIGNWQITGIATFQKGFPYSVAASDIQGANGTVAPRANIVSGCNLHANTYSGNLAQFSRLNISCFTQPPLGTYGNTGRNFLTQPGINNWDMSIGKGFAFGEGVQFQFKADAFNAFNHHQYGGDVNGLLVAGSGGNETISNSVGSATGGLITGASSSRILQLGGKITF